MTNKEFCELEESLAEMTCTLLQNCGCDMTKIDKALWAELVNIYTKIEDYV